MAGNTEIMNLLEKGKFLNLKLSMAKKFQLKSRPYFGKSRASGPTGEVLEKMKLQPNPFQLFPFEIWEKILEICEDPQAIQNVLTAYPIMEGLVLPIKSSWMLDLVLPSIRPWLENSDMLSCRRVCRRWSKAVDNYMETHPRLYTTKVNLINRSSPFYRDMEECPRGRNPFVGRMTELDFGDGEMTMLDWEPEDVPELFPGEFWMKTLSALQKFGGHLWSLWVSPGRPEQQHFYERFITALALLPNLRRLDVDVRLDPEPELEIVEALPPLPRLHTLWFYSLGRATFLSNMLVQRYSAQIKCLRISLSKWRVPYSTLFPQLISLTVGGIKSHKEATDFLGSLQAPKLLRLQLELSYKTDGDIASLLKRFGQLKSLHLKVSSLDRGGPKDDSCNPIHWDTIPSLKSLRITATISTKINFHFLQSFPSLECLRIKSKFHKLPYFKANGIHKLDLWEMLPKLREISVDNVLLKHGDREARVHCNRAQYERLRKIKSQKRQCSIV